MASAQTNSTIWTIAFVGAGGFIIWKLFGKGTKTASAGVGAAGGYPNYYAPQQSQPQGGSPQLSIGGGGGSNPGKSGGGAGSSGSDSSDPLTQFFNLITNDDQLDASNFDYSGTSVASDNYDGTLSTSDFSIPLEDADEQLNMDGTFITSANDGSANAVSAEDSGLAETQGDEGTYSIPQDGSDDGGDDGGDDGDDGD
jgi:hypothetical protein